MPSTGHLLAGTHAQSIADLHVFERDVLLAPSSSSAPCDLRRQAEQRADRRARAAARAQLEHLAEQHQDDDHRRVRNRLRPAPCIRNDCGNTSGSERRRRRCRRYAAPTPSAISVNMFELPVHDRRPAALRRTASRPTARPASPARARSSSLAGACDAAGRAACRAACSDHEQQDRQRASAETDRTAASCRPARGSRSSTRDDPRLERHAADRAGAGRVAHDLRVHRAGPLVRVGAAGRRPARAPCRTSGRRRGDPAAPRGPSGRCIRAAASRRAAAGLGGRRTAA